MNYIDIIQNILVLHVDPIKDKPHCNARTCIRSHIFLYVTYDTLLATLFAALSEFQQSDFHCCFFRLQI